MTDKTTEITLTLPADLAKRIEVYAAIRRVTIDEMAQRLFSHFLHFFEQSKNKDVL